MNPIYGIGAGMVNKLRNGVMNRIQTEQYAQPNAQQAQDINNVYGAGSWGMPQPPNRLQPGADTKPRTGIKGFISNMYGLGQR